MAASFARLWQRIRRAMPEQGSVRDGILDIGYDPGPGANDRVRCLLPLDDGRLLVGGDFTAFGGKPRHHVARLNADGSLDPAFVTPAGVTGAVFAMALQPDGQVVVAGWGALGTPSIARLHPDGGPDPSFSLGTEFFGYFYAVAVQHDGRLLVGGSYTGINGVRLRRIARLLPDGRVDPTFDPGEGFSNGHPEQEATVRCIVVRSDGHALVGGDFSHFHGVARCGIACLRPDGTLDPTFDPQGGFSGPVSALALRPDGRVLVGGNYTSFGGRPCPRIVQLDAQGRRDPSFVPDRCFTGEVTGLVVDPHGRVLAAGAHHTPYGEVQDRVVRLTPQGHRDPAFLGLHDLDGQVRSLMLARDGSVVLAGDITRAGGLPCRGLARLKRAVEGGG